MYLEVVNIGTQRNIRWKRLAVSLILVLLASVLTSAAVAHQPGFGPTSPTFSIGISTDRPSVQVGAQVLLDIVLTNLSDHDLDCSGVASNGLDRSYEYEVKDSAGKPLPRRQLTHPEIGETFSPWPCTVKPGTSARAAGGVISQLYSFEKPGRYTVIVSDAWKDHREPW